MLEIGLRDVRLFNYVINISPCVHVKFNIRGASVACRIALGSCRLLTKSKKENKMFENTVSKDEEQNKEGKL